MIRGALDAVGGTDDRGDVRHLLLALAIVSLAACAGGPAPTDAVATWPVTAEVLASATSGTADARLTCGGRTFPASGLNAATGAETRTGPEFDALRASLVKFADVFPAQGDWTWRLAGRDETGAVFLASAPAIDPPWVYVEVATGPDGWQPMGIGTCELHVVLSSEFGPASWALDPAFATPQSDTTELHILVWERACSGGSPTTGRMSAPVIEFDTGNVMITIGVRPLEGISTCPKPPGTPAVIRLAEPLGQRSLLDGGGVPAAPPSP